jgi:hypothetical protein
MANKTSTFKTRFIDVNLQQETYSPTSVRAIKEIFASKNGVLPHNIKSLDFQKCRKALIIDKARNFEKVMSANGNIITL